MNPTRPTGPRGRRGALLLELLLALAGALGAVFLVLRHWAGDNCLERIADHEVAVVSSATGGPARVVDTPGYVAFLPWLEELHRIDRSPLEYVMADAPEKGAAAAPKLIVRGRDGTSFWFDTVRIQYAVDPSRAPFVLEDSGPDGARRRALVDAYARSVLRAEYGRHTSEEIVEPDNRHAAAARTREALERELARHGLVVLDVAVSKPSFAKPYEATIERRKVAEQELEHLERRLATALADRARRLEVAGREAARQDELARLQLAAELDQARAQMQRQRDEADLYRDDRLAAAEREREARELEASLLLDRASKEAEGRHARAEAFAAQGELAVRAALIERLAGIDFVLVPPAWRPESPAGAGQAVPRVP